MDFGGCFEGAYTCIDEGVAILLRICQGFSDFSVGMCQIGKSLQVKYNYFTAEFSCS